MRDIIRYGLILAVFCIISSSLLAVTYHYSSLEIQRQEELKKTEGYRQVLPTADQFLEEGGVLKGYSKGTLAGCVFKTEEFGYASAISILIGVDTQGTITGLKILSQQESPGLGARITEIRPGEKTTWFQQQFVGKKIEDLAFRRDGGKIDSITGATISSRTVLDMARNAAQSKECT